MKNIIFLLSVIFVTQIFPTNIYGQEQQEKKLLKNKITLNIGRLILNEARFGYERQLSERHILRTVIGLQYPTNSESFESIPYGIFYSPFYYDVSKGIYLGIGYNYLLGIHSKIYLSSEIYFDYNYYDKKYYHYRVGMDMDSYVSLESMDLRKTGLKILFGKKASIISGRKVGLELDFFAGFGFQYRFKELTVFEKKNGSSSWDYSELFKKNPPEINTYKNWYPSLHVGILIGMPF